MKLALNLNLKMGCMKRHLVMEDPMEKDMVIFYEVS